LIRRLALPFIIAAISLPHFSTAHAETEATETSGPAAKITLGASGFGGVPLGDAGDVLDAGVGFLGSLDYPLNPQVELTGRIGYIHYLTDGEGFSFSEIPIWGGARYFLNPSQESVYLHGETGFNIFRASINTQFGDASDSESELALNLLAGKKFGTLVAEGGLYIGSVDEMDDTLMVGGTIGKTF
jgi:hypothetical protein